MIDSLRPRGLYSPWNPPSQSDGVGCHSLLQGIFPAQGWNPGHPNCRWILYQLRYQGSPAFCWAEALLPSETGLGACKPLSQHFFGQLTSNFVLCVFLFQDTFLIILIYCAFINTELTANSTLTQAWTKLTKYMVLHRAPHSLLTLRNTRQHFSTALGSHCEHGHHQQKTPQKCINKKWHQIDQEKTHYRMSAETHKGAQRPAQLAPQPNRTVRSSAHDDQSTAKIGLGITNKF